MRKIDDIEQAENDGEAERQHGVKRTIDQAQQQLGQQGREGYAENFHDRVENAAREPGRAAARIIS
jgi:hypothetical protein